VDERSRLTPEESIWAVRPSFVPFRARSHAVIGGRDQLLAKGKGEGARDETSLAQRL
jgi:hypothetical protein